jgi:glucarate dehydratase
MPTRRDFLQTLASTSAALALPHACGFAQTTNPAPSARKTPPLKVTAVTITPIALPDPPILAASGCHGPYFLRNIVEIKTDAGITGIGETHGGQRKLNALRKATKLVVGKDAFAYRAFRKTVSQLGNDVYAGIELACLDAAGKAVGKRLCELLGGPVREEVEFSAYLFYRFPADHKQVLSDPRLVDNRGKGSKALDQWGEVRTPEAMANLAEAFRKKWGFRNFKLKAGVLKPDQELSTIDAMNAKFGGKHLLRIDPNARWTVSTALRIGEKLKKYPLEYYEDPVRGQMLMAEVRKKLRLPMSTNMCVTRFEHIPRALKVEPIDVVLGDHHGWGGIIAVQELGRICETVGWKLSQHSNSHAGVTMAAMTHVGAVVPQLTVASDTHYVQLAEGHDIIVGEKLPIKDGKIKVPSGVGLGVSLDRDKLANAHEVYRKCGMRERGDAGTMRRFVPGWKRTLS